MTKITKATLAMVTLVTFANPAYADDKQDTTKTDAVIDASTQVLLYICAQSVPEEAPPPQKTEGLLDTVVNRTVDAVKNTTGIDVRAMSSAEARERQCRANFPLIATYVDSPSKFVLGVSAVSTFAWFAMAFFFFFCFIYWRDDEKFQPEPGDTDEEEFTKRNGDNNSRIMRILVALALGRILVFFLDIQIFHGEMAAGWLYPIYLTVMLVPFGISMMREGSPVKFFGTLHATLPALPKARKKGPAASQRKCPQCGKLSLNRGVCTADCGYEEATSASAPAPAVATATAAAPAAAPAPATATPPSASQPRKKRKLPPPKSDRYL